MKTDAVVKTKIIDKNNKRVEVYSPKFPGGIPLANLNASYEGKPIKLITSWKDVPIKEPVTINGSVIDSASVGQCALSMGMVIGCFEDENVYVVTHQRLLGHK